jgi:hypothetical protein
LPVDFGPTALHDIGTFDTVAKLTLLSESASATIRERARRRLSTFVSWHPDDAEPAYRRASHAQLTFRRSNKRCRASMPAFT